MARTSARTSTPRTTRTNQAKNPIPHTGNLVRFSMYTMTLLVFVSPRIFGFLTNSSGFRYASPSTRYRTMIEMDFSSLVRFRFTSLAMIDTGLPLYSVTVNSRSRLNDSTIAANKYQRRLSNGLSLDHSTAVSRLASPAFAA